MSAGYKLNILCAQNLAELSRFDAEIFEQLYPANIHIINYQKETLWGRYLRVKSAIRLKLVNAGFIKSLKKYKWLAQSRMLPEMKFALKSIKTDLYIAHTVAAFPAAAWAAEYHHSKYALDAEDYHSGETNNIERQQIITALENEFIQNCAYLSTASPLSSEFYRKRYPEVKIITINNVFPFSHINSEGSTVSKPLKLVWFSQTIGLNRGLQEFIQALSALEFNLFELHLRGSYTEEVKSALLNYTTEEWKSRIFFYPQCSGIYLEEWLRHFDIGLALEHSGDLNKKLCISNKIFQYISAGLGVIATNTNGQKWVFDKTPGIGIVVREDDMGSAACQLAYWTENPETLETAKQQSVNAAKLIFNWDLEKNKLLEQISLISKN
ncbi:glycosyltransferase family protein [Pedobacter insulae]|uniref:hypothetical protein n=1 Tax=Pedobacter insulae TaxID=414048 RepID=UPI001C42E921|nr:hypothetical protein [Pedobacter insulae]